jgi:hypothetical protein
MSLRCYLQVHLDVIFEFTSSSLRFNVRIHFDCTFDFTLYFTSNTTSKSLSNAFLFDFRIHFDFTVEFTPSSLRCHTRIHFDRLAQASSTVLDCTVLHCNRLWFWDRRFFKMLGIGTSHKRLLYCTVLYCTVRAYMMYVQCDPMQSSCCVFANKQPWMVTVYR